MALRLPDESGWVEAPSEAEVVFSWRAEQFELLGFGQWSQTLANLDVDLAQARALIEGGCPVGTALQILV